MARDPICGMTVNEATARSAERDGVTYYFCCEGCRQKFLNPDPAAPVFVQLSLTPAAPGQVAAKASAKYFCPMCDGVESDKPGDCPKCGMALERNPAVAGADHEEDGAELRSMTLRLRVGAALALPVFALAMSHAMPAWSHAEWVMGDASRWGQFVFSTPVVWWAGWPFFVRGCRSLVNRSLNMFTLIAIGVGAAYGFSVVALLAPGGIPRCGADMARSRRSISRRPRSSPCWCCWDRCSSCAHAQRTSGAIKALLGLAPTSARRVTPSWR